MAKGNLKTKRNEVENMIIDFVLENFVNEPEGDTPNPKDDFANANSGKVDSLKDERALYLCRHGKNRFGGDDEVFRCDNFIKINNVQFDYKNHIALSKAELMALFKNSYSLLKPGPKDILFLKMILGADSSSNTMHIFFQPVSFTLTAEIIDAMLQSQGIFEIAKSGPVYDYKDSKFQESSEVPYTEYYKTTVTMPQNQVDGSEIFDPAKNVTSVLFTFQEIFNFIHTNNLSEVKVLSCVRRFYAINKGLVNKHSLILAKDLPAVKLIGPTLIPVPFKNVYSNLTHLCPPNCSQLIHPLERLEF
jgi:hypothetical protein